MPRNGSGTYSLPASSWNPAVTGTTIESSAANTTLTDLASALTQSVSKDGQTALTGNLPMGNNKLTGLANGAVATDSAAYGQLLAVASVASVNTAAVASTVAAVASVVSTLSVGLDLAKMKSFVIACSGETAILTAGAAKVSFYMPYAFTVTEVAAGLNVAQATGSTVTIDINEAGSTILSTPITIDNTELTSWTASVPPVIAGPAIAAQALMTIDVDQVGSATVAAGLKIYINGYVTA